MSNDHPARTGMSSTELEAVRPVLHAMLDEMLDRARRDTASIDLVRNVDLVPTPHPRDPERSVFLDMGSTLTITVKDRKPLYSAEEIDELLSKGEARSA